MNAVKTECVSINCEISGHLYDSLTDYIENHPGWDASKAIESAVALFLLQNSPSADRTASKHYLQSVFGGQESA